MHQGKTTGLICQGFNPMMSVSHKVKNIAALSKLKFLVSIDPIETDTARFWENHGVYNDVDPSQIQTEVFMLPAGCFAEEDGTFTNSSRNIIWKWKAADIPGEGRRDIDIVELFMQLRKLYQGKAARAEQFLNAGTTQIRTRPADELLKGINGRALMDLRR